MLSLAPTGKRVGFRSSRVKADGISDVAGSYALTDAQTGEAVVILDNDFSAFQDTWKVRDTETEAKIAEINSRGRG